MRLLDMLELVRDHAARHKGRTALTLLGVIVGIAAIVAVAGLGEGFREKIAHDFSGPKAQVFEVIPGQGRVDIQPDRTEVTELPGRGSDLRAGDLRFLKLSLGPVPIDAEVSGHGFIQHGPEQLLIGWNGVDPAAWPIVNPTSLEQGRLIAPGDVNAVVVGHDVAHKLYSNPVSVNDTLVIGNVTLRVVGILDPVGSFSLQSDSDVYFPRDIALNFTHLPLGTYSSFWVRAPPGQDPGELASKADGALSTYRDVLSQKRDYTILTPQAIHAQLTGLLDTVDLVLVGIAAIALGVGGLGIANTMLMTVFERAKEIGILRALGATRAEVARLFALEATLLGLVGGALGIALGWMIGVVISLVGIQALGTGADAIHAALTPAILGLALAFSILVGGLAGAWPAVRASRSEPTEILRSV